MSPVSEALGESPDTLPVDAGSALSAAEDEANSGYYVSSGLLMYRVNLTTIVGLPDPIPAGAPPEITSPPAIVVAENTIFVEAVTATDPDGDAVSFAISGGADKAAFLIDGATGALRFAAPPDFETPASAAGTNLYEVVVAATDSKGLSTTQTLSVTVSDVAVEDSVIIGTGDTVDLVGTSGNDTIIGLDAAQPGVDPGFVIHGNAGNDVIVDGNRDSQIFGDAGDDTIDGGAGDDTVDGGPGPGHLFGGAGDDQITGGDDADVIVDLSGNNHVDGGGGADFVITGDGDDGIKTFDGDDTIQSGAGNDVITGNDGGFGNVVVDAGAGDDLVIGGYGENVISGGDGNDRLSSASDDRIVFDENGQFTLRSGRCFIDGGTGDDRISVSGSESTVLGGSGNDSIDGHARFIDAGDGDDIVDATADFIVGGAGNDTLSSGSAGALVLGGDGDDTIIATQDISFAIVRSADGQSFFRYGLGADVPQDPAILIGGAGNDTFVFGNRPAVAVIADFGAGDRIEYRDQFFFADSAAVLAAARQVGTDVEIVYDSAHAVFLRDVALANLTTDSFHVA